MKASPVHLACRGGRAHGRWMRTGALAKMQRLTQKESKALRALAHIGRPAWWRWISFILSTIMYS